MKNFISETVNRLIELEFFVKIQMIDSSIIQKSMDRINAIIDETSREIGIQQ